MDSQSTTYKQSHSIETVIGNLTSVLKTQLSTEMYNKLNQSVTSLKVFLNIINKMNDGQQLQISGIYVKQLQQICSIYNQLLATIKKNRNTSYNVYNFWTRVKQYTNSNIISLNTLSQTNQKLNNQLKQQEGIIANIKNLQKRMADILQNKYYYYVQSGSQSFKCYSYLQQIYKRLKDAESKQYKSKIKELVQAQNRILIGNFNQQSYPKYNSLPFSEVQSILHPIINDSKKTEQLLNKLKLLTNKPKQNYNIRQPNTMTIQCLQLVSTLQQQLNKISSIILKQVVPDNKIINLSTTGKSFGLPTNLTLCQLLSVCTQNNQIMQLINQRIKSARNQYNKDGQISKKYFINPNISKAQIRFPTMNKTQSYSQTSSPSKQNENTWNNTYTKNNQLQQKIHKLQVKNSINFAQIIQLRKQKQKYEQLANKYLEQCNKNKIHQQATLQKIKQLQICIQQKQQTISTINSALIKVTQISKQKEQQITKFKQQIQNMNMNTKIGLNKDIINNNMHNNTYNQGNNWKQQYNKLQQSIQNCITKFRQSDSAYQKQSGLTIQRVVSYLIEQKNKQKNNTIQFFNKIKELKIQQQLQNFADIYNYLEYCLAYNDTVNIIYDKIIQNLSQIISDVIKKQTQIMTNKQIPKYQIIYNKIKIIKGYCTKKLVQNISSIQYKTKMFSCLQNQQFVMKNLNLQLKNNIQQFSLLYRSNKKCSANCVSQIIQKHPNILMLIKIANGNTLACYSSLSFCETKDNKQRQAFIISTHSQSVYPLRQGQQPVANNPQYIIFGNETIKINKNFDSKMQVKFDNLSAYNNIINKSFHSILNLTGQNNKAIEIEGFQIYQIILKNSQIIQLSPTKSNIFNKQQPRLQSILQKHTSPKNNTINQSVINQQRPNTYRNASRNKQLQQYQQLKQQNQKYQRSIKILQRQNDELSKQLKNYKNEGSINIKPNIQLINEAKIEQIQNKSKLHSAQKNPIKITEDDKKQLDQFKKRCQKAQQQTKILKYKLNQQQMTINQFNNKAQVYQKKIKQLQHKITQLQNNIQTNKQQKTKIQQKLKNSQKQLNKLKQLQKLQIRQNSQSLSKKPSIFINNLEDQIKSKKQQVNFLQQQINKGIQILNKLKQKHIKYQKKIEQSQNKINQLENIINDKTIQISNIQLQLKSYKDQIKLIKNSRQELQKLNKQKQNAKQATKKQQEQVKRLKEQVLKEKKNIQTAQNSIKTLFENKKKIDDQYNTKFKSTAQLAEKERQIKQKFNQINKQLQVKNKEKEEFDNFMKNMDQNKRNNQLLKIQVSNLKLQIQKLTNCKKDLNFDKSELEKQLINLKYQKTNQLQLNKKISQLQDILDKKAKDQNKLQQSLKQLKQKQQKQKMKHQQLIAKYKREQQIHQQKSKLYKTQKQQLINQIAKIQSQLIQKKKNFISIGGYLNRFFVGQIIEDELDREFIIDQLIKIYPKRTIQKTKLIFSFPLMAGINPHQVMDSQPNYMILMKMQKKGNNNQNYLMAMYSEMCLTENKTTINKRPGFVSSITNRKTFTLKIDSQYNPRLTQYNQSQFRFGNQQIRFKTNSFLLQTSIGHLYRWLNTPYQMKNPQIFTGQSSENAKFQGYQIYQIIFSQLQ